jgi:hypothetical protein
VRATERNKQKGAKRKKTWCEVKVIVMMVRYESENLEVRRTCGSVRSSLSAPARLVTVGSEAAETTPLHHLGAEISVRKSLRLQASMRSEGQGWMTCPTYVNCRRHRDFRRAKGADRLEPKRYAVRCSIQVVGHTDTKTAGVLAGANSSMSLQSNTVNLTFRPTGAGGSARDIVGMAGKGCRRKQKPSCNRADRSCNIAPPRKRADFRWVVRYERVGRTFMGGDCK